MEFVVEINTHFGTVRTVFTDADAAVKCWRQYVNEGRHATIFTRRS